MQVILGGFQMNWQSQITWLALEPQTVVQLTSNEATLLEAGLDANLIQPSPVICLAPMTKRPFQLFNWQIFKRCCVRL